MLPSSSLHLHTGIVTVPLLLLISYLTLTLSQIIPPQQSAPSPPTVAACGPSLLPLASCAAFVQGRSPGPILQCCQNLVQAYDEQPGCLCLFLNGTALASLPINSTRALQLPELCDVHINSASCSSSGGSGHPKAPASQVSFRRNPTTSTAGAPTVTVAPRPSTVKFGMRQNSAYRLAQGQFGVAGAFLLLATLLP